MARSHQSNAHHNISGSCSQTLCFWIPLGFDLNHYEKAPENEALFKVGGGDGKGERVVGVVAFLGRDVTVTTV